MFMLVSFWEGRIEYIVYTNNMKLKGDEVYHWPLVNLSRNVLNSILHPMHIPVPKKKISFHGGMFWAFSLFWLEHFYYFLLPKSNLNMYMLFKIGHFKKFDSSFENIIGKVFEMTRLLFLIFS